MRVLVLGALVLAAVAVGCGGGKDEPDGAPPPEGVVTATLLTATPSPRPSPTPSPTPGPKVFVPKGCSQWPAAVAGLIDRLPHPANLCLKYASKLREMPPTCDNVTACYVWQTTTVWKLEAKAEKDLPRYALTGATLEHVLAHEVCHSYQHWFSRNWYVGGSAGGDVGVFGWIETPQGKAYLEAESQVNLAAMPFPGQPLENFAEVCAAWLAPGAGNRALLERWPSLRAFAEVWLRY